MYVGVQFAGTPKQPTHIHAMQKFSRAGPASKWMRARPQVALTHGVHRAVVMALPRTFVLRNDLVQQVCRQLQCSWDMGKYHVYRLAATDIIGVPAEWPEFSQPQGEMTKVISDPHRLEDLPDVPIPDLAVPTPS